MDVQAVNGVNKRCQHRCKMCSILKASKDERTATKFYCGVCSDGAARYIVNFGGGAY